MTWLLVIAAIPALLGGFVALGNCASVLNVIINKPKGGTSLIWFAGSALLWIAASLCAIAGRPLTASIVASVSLLDMGGPHWYAIWWIGSKRGTKS